MGYRHLTPEQITNVRDYVILSLQNAEISVDHDKVDCLLDFAWRFRHRKKRGETDVPDGRYLDLLGNWKFVRMPRVLCNVLDKPGVIVHVIDGDGTDMRMDNLVVTSRSVIEKAKGRHNRMAGISWNKRTHLWQVYACLAGQSVWCGSYADVCDAIAARDDELSTLANKYKKDLAIPEFEITRFR